MDRSYMKHSRIVVKTFDGTKQEVIGEIKIVMQIGPCMFNIEFQVMDISPSYNCLIERPWIHMAGAIPSMLHQKIKFIMEGQLICVAVENDMIVATLSGVLYVKVNERTLECSFRFLEFVNAMYVGEGSKVSMPKLSKTTHLTLKQVLGKGVRACLNQLWSSRKRIDPV